MVVTVSCVIVDVKNFDLVLVFIILSQFSLNFWLNSNNFTTNQIETKFEFYINVALIFLTRLNLHFTLNFI